MLSVFVTRIRILVKDKDVRTYFVRAFRFSCAAPYEPCLLLTKQKELTFATLSVTSLDRKCCSIVLVADIYV